MKKKHVLMGGGLVVVLLLLWVGWNAWFRPTDVAFVNYQVVSLGEIAKANTNPFIRIRELSTDRLDELADYDMVFVNGMGLRITEEQRELIRQAADDGLPVLTTAATNPANRICSLDSVRSGALMQYLGNGGRRNYRSLLAYVRKYIDGKLYSADEPEAVAERPDDLFYHADPSHPDDEEAGFNTVADYEAFLKKHDLYKADAPAVILTGQMGEPADLIRRLEETGNRVYPVRSLSALIRTGMADSICPAAVINMAHGRMGDFVADYLARRNIPLFAPLNVNRPVDEWEADKMGMNGGFLSQSVVTPEIDGAIRPFALFGHYKDDEGLQHVFAIPERLETFVATVNRYIGLQRKPNGEKRIAIYYYKGPGQNALTASGMEVIPSLYNLLVRLKKEGYRVDGLPSSPDGLARLIQEQGAVFGTYAEGASSRFMQTARPELVTREQYEGWVKQALRPGQYAEVVREYGEFPGDYMTTSDGRLAVARIRLGNVVLLPQPAAGKGDNAFKIVHGTDAAPSHLYIAAYLWAEYGFGADALVHFGTHGSLEFTPRKQVALCSDDWPDRLVGPLPHFYVYSIGNVGEGIIAKRRSYAGLQSYLTPPFLESSVRGIYRDLMEKIKAYNHKAASHAGGKELEQASLAVKALTLKMGIHRELELDSVAGHPYGEDDITRIEDFAEELATEKITGQLYTMGVPYEPARIASSVRAMTIEPIAYGLLSLDRLRGRADEQTLKRKALFTERYLTPARSLVDRLLADRVRATDELVCRTAGITSDELARVREIEERRNAPSGMMAMMMGEKNTGKAVTYTREEVRFALAVAEVERAIRNVDDYRTALQDSPERELASLVNALRGGYTRPSPGGDPIANPNTLPTGRNLYSINAEETPTESAWEKGRQLAENTIEMYRRRHNDSIPRKVSYTLWSGEFIETGGATIAQVLYMLGVEPVRDSFGRVTDLRLIPSKELGRPRIDVVVQTSGQLRDLAASRLFLINRAVEMAAAARDDAYENQVAEGVKEAERTLIEKGLTPKDAREVSTFRVFGGVGGNYGTGIQGMVMSGDRWESEKEIADTYLNNMGAYYGSEKGWESFRQSAFEAALTRTDAVVQPRQGNTWGALSLDHVYEFMGGMNLAVRNVTGKDPDAYLSDYRNRNNVRMQEVKEAIGVESRTTLFNPTYIREKMKGGAGGASTFAATIQNTYAWNVMKPRAVDKAMWDEIYNVYVKDKFDLGIRQYFEEKNPAALEEMTAVMLESVRKGLWKADDRQVADIARLHTELVEEYKPSCSGFVCDNAKLRRFIASKVNAETASSYHENIDRIRETAATAQPTDKGLVMKKEEMNTESTEAQTNRVSNTLVGCLVAVAFVVLVVVVRRRRKKMQE